MGAKLGLFLSACLLAQATGESTYSPSTSPLFPRVEAVVVKARLLPAELLGGPLDSYRVFACRPSGLSVIPFQIDEVDKEGTVMVKQGPGAPRTDGLLSPEDEVVFMAWDAGPGDECRMPEGCSAPATVKITDPLSRNTAQVLIAQCANPPPLSPKTYAAYDPNLRTVTTTRYQLGWREAPVYYYDYITINHGPDLLDRLKVRCTIGKWRLTYTFNEEFFQHRLIGWTNGPVRVIWHGENYWSLGPLGKIPIPAFAYFYRDYIFMINPMDARFNPALFGLDFYVTIAHDLNLDRSRGYRICTNTLVNCLPLGAPLSPEKIKELAEQDMVWGGVEGPEGALITRFVLDPELKARVIGEFRDGPDPYPPEYIPGSSPFMGFKIINWKDVKPRIYNLNFYHFFMNHYSLENFKRFDSMISAPLSVSVNRTRP